MREGPIFYDIGVDEQDPFVMMSWRCKKLSSFSVIGLLYYITYYFIYAWVYVLVYV